MSDADVSRLNFQLLVTTQERDTGYQERDRFQEFYQITSRRAELLDRENQELQRSIMDLQELVAECQSGAIYQRLNAEVETLIDENSALQEEVRHLREIESTRFIPTTLLEATLEKVRLERDRLELEKESMSDQLMEKSGRIKELEIQLYSEKSEKEELTLQLCNTARNDTEQTVEVTEAVMNEMELRIMEKERNEVEQKAGALEKELSAARQKLSETAHQLESMREELANVTRDYDALRTEHRQLCHRMQRRRWLDQRLQKHFHQRNPPAVHQDASIVRSLHERFQSLVRRRRAAVLMESLCFAFFVAKQQDAARAHIIHGTAVSDDDRWEVVEGGANPEGVAVLEGDPEGVADVVPEKEEGRVYYRSELVVPSAVCKVLRHYLPADVQREASETQDESLQSPLSSFINLVCPSSVDRSSCWLGLPHHQGKCRQRMRVVRSINRRCSRCGQPLKKSLLPSQPHSTRCGKGISRGGWPPDMATFRRQVQRYMRGVV